MIRRGIHPAEPPRYAAVFDPGTMAILSLVGTAVGAVTSMGGQIMGARSQSQAASYQAQVATNAQKVATQNAQYAVQAGAQREEASRMRTAGLIGAQRATAAAHGVDVNSGSAVDVQSDAATLGELDALTIRNNAAREAYNYKVAGAGYGAQAGLLNYQAGEDTMGGWAAGFGSLISGAGSFGDKWMSYQQHGVPGF